MAGSHSATVRAPCGEPSSVTSATDWPISSEAVAAGAAVVALAKITVGLDVYRVQSRSRRRSTIATLDPKTPR